MVKKSKQQTERLVYREDLHRSNDMNEGIYRSSSRIPYTSNDLDKEGYNAPFIPKSTSYVDYTKQYFSKSDASKSSANVDALSTHQRSVTSTFPIVATYDYSPFGELIATSGTPELSPIQFSSEVFDPETALVYYNHRYYNPTDGRWLSRDPAGESASLNLYAFVKNAPNYRTDYLGLEDKITYVEEDANLGHAWIRTGKINTRYTGFPDFEFVRYPEGWGFYPKNPLDKDASKLTGILTMVEGAWNYDEFSYEYKFLKKNINLIEYDTKTLVAAKLYIDGFDFTPQVLMKYGLAKNITCSCSNYMTKLDCLKNHKERDTVSNYSLIIGSCRDRARSVLKDCCMDIDTSTKNSARQLGSIIKLNDLDTEIYKP